jgi:hypothetical protein
MRSNSIKALPSGPKVLIQPQRGRYAQTVRAHATSRARMRKRLVAEATPVTSDVGADRPPAVPSIRASQVLREILTKNPKAKNFTVQQIVDAIGENQVATSLVFFSIPGMLPIPGTSNLSGIPAGLIAGQMIAGKTEIKLPAFILRRSVPRRSLAVAIYAILPVLEIAEKAAKPRQLWASHPAVQRVLGVFILLLALVIALPFFGFNVAHAASIFIISLGLAEHDGVAILIGVLAGLASLILLTGADLSIGALRFGAIDWMKKMLKKVGLKWAAKLGFRWAARYLKKRSVQWTTLVLLEWAELLLDPQGSARIKANKPKRNALKITRKSSSVRRGQNLASGSARRAYTQAAERSPISKRTARSIQR